MNEKSKLTDAQKSILKIFAENDMNISKAAKTAILHRNTYEYHLNKIQEVTGRDPRCFYDLVELLKEC